MDASVLGLDLPPVAEAAFSAVMSHLDSAQRKARTLCVSSQLLGSLCMRRSVLSTSNLAEGKPDCVLTWSPPRRLYAA